MGRHEHNCPLKEAAMRIEPSHIALRVT